MSAINDALKRAEGKKETNPAAQTEPAARRHAAGSKRAIFLPIFLSLGWAATLLLFLHERDLVLQTGTELAEKTAELDERDARISALMDENMELEQGLNERLSGLEGKLKEAEDEIEALKSEKESLFSESADKTKKIGELENKLKAIESEKDAITAQPSPAVPLNKG